jgi:hypothetical protein
MPVTKIPRRVWLLSLVGLALLTVLLLAGSLQNLKFLPGHPLPFQQLMPDLEDEDAGNLNTQRFINIMRVFFIVGWVLLPFYVIYLIISPEARKRFLRDLIAMTPLLLILYFLMREPPGGDVMQEFERRMETGPLEEIQITPVPQVQFDANPSEWLVTFTTIILAVAATGLIVGIIYLFLRSRQPKQQPLTRVAFEAQAAIDAIQAGGDLRDVVLRCYFEMNRAIGDSRNIKRNADMTVHEFESYLLDRGLPSEPIHNLTELFEKVRYGAFQPGRTEERLAISSLSAIVSACQRAAR